MIRKRIPPTMQIIAYAGKNEDGTKKHAAVRPKKITAFSGHQLPKRKTKRSTHEEKKDNRRRKDAPVVKFGAIPLAGGDSNGKDAQEGMIQYKAHTNAVDPEIVKAVSRAPLQIHRNNGRPPISKSRKSRTLQSFFIYLN